MHRNTHPNIVLNKINPLYDLYHTLNHWCSPFIFSLYTHDCVPAHNTNAIIKFADNTTVVGLITDNHETAYREEVQRLTDWCSDNNPTLNTKKTEELIIDFRKQQKVHHSQWQTGASLQFQVSGNTPLRGPLMDNKYKFTGEVTTIVLPKNAQKPWTLSQHHLVSFYHCSIESVLTYGILVWYRNSSAGNKKALQWVIKTADRITNTHLPTLENIYTSRCLRKASCIARDCYHPADTLFGGGTLPWLRVMWVNVQFSLSFFFYIHNFLYFYTDYLSTIWDSVPEYHCACLCL